MEAVLALTASRLLPEPDAEGSALLDWWMPVAESGVVSTRLLELALPLRRLRERGD